MPVRFTSYKKEVLDKVRQAKARALEICGGTAEGYAKQGCPVDSGALRNSITHEQRSEDTEAVGTDMYYAPFVEYGHNQQPGRYVPVLGKRLVASHVAAKPFMAPAVEGHQKEFEGIIRSELNI